MMRVLIVRLLLVCLIVSGTHRSWSQEDSNPAKSKAQREDAVPGQSNTATDSIGDPLPEGAIRRFGTLRMKHDPGSTGELALSPDEKSIISMNAEIVVWDTATGKEKWRSASQVSRQNSCYGNRLLAFSSDNTRFYTPGIDRDIQIWNLETGTSESVAVQNSKLVSRREGHGAMSIDVTRDGSRIAFGTSEGLSVCDDQGTVIFEIVNESLKDPDFNNDRLAFGGGYTYGRFSPDGKTLAVTADDHPDDVRLFRSEDGELLKTIPVKGRIVRMEFSPDSQQLATTERDNAVRLYDAGIGTEIWSHIVELVNPYETYTSAIAFSPDGKTIAAGATDHRIYLLDAKSGDESGRLKGTSWYPWALAFTADSKKLYSSGWDSNIRSWDVENRKQLPLPSGSRASAVVTISPDGKWIAFVDDAHSVHLVNSTSGEELRALSVDKMGFTELRFSPDSQMLAGGGSAEDQVQVVIWSVNDGTQKHLFHWDKGRDPHSEVEALAFTPDGTRVAVAVFRQGFIRVWDLSKGNEVIQFKHANVYGMSFSPDGKKLASAGWDKVIRFWETEGWSEDHVHQLSDDNGQNGDMRMYTVCYSPDGSLATAHLDGTVRIWESEEMQLRCQFRVEGRFLFGAMNFSPDGLWLATGSQNGQVDLWDSWTGKHVRAVGSHRNEIYTLNFGCDSRILVSGGSDDICYQWDLRLPDLNAPKLDPEQLWIHLTRDDPAAGFQAMLALSDDPERTVELLANKLRTVRSAVDPARVGRDQPDEERERRRRITQLMTERDPKVKSVNTIRRATALLAGAGTPHAKGLLEELTSRDPDGNLGKFANSALKRFK